MSDLADALLLSRGGATRLVARAEDDGLVRREIPPDDRRATYAVLTDAGGEAAERGLPVYLEAVQRLFHDFVDDSEAEVLVRVWNRVLEGNDMACAPVSHAAEALESEARRGLTRRYRRQLATSARRIAFATYLRRCVTCSHVKRSVR